MGKQILVLAGLLATGAVLAQGAPPAGGGSGGSDPPALTGPKLDQSLVFSELDKNKDGKVTKEEWLAGGLPEFLYGMADKQKSGSITLEQLSATTPPSDMDANKDGKLGLQEMRAYIAKNAAPDGSARSGGPAGGSSPP